MLTKLRYNVLYKAETNFNFDAFSFKKQNIEFFRRFVHIYRNIFDKRRLFVYNYLGVIFKNYILPYLDLKYQSIIYLTAKT